MRLFQKIVSLFFMSIGKVKKNFEKKLKYLFLNKENYYILGVISVIYRDFKFLKKKFGFEKQSFLIFLKMLYISKN